MSDLAVIMTFLLSPSYLKEARYFTNWREKQKSGNSTNIYMSVHNNILLLQWDE